MTNLKRIIDEKGVQQRWLAEAVGVTEVSMSRYVSGERIPKAPIAIRMADALGVNVKDLYGWESEKRTEERTETHDVCLDTISRQAAIRWVKTECNPYGKPTLDFESGKKIIEHLEQMPSAQPEIIHCRDCKKNPHWEWVGCPMTGRNTRKPNDFCSYAERRTDEAD